MKNVLLLATVTIMTISACNLDPKPEELIIGRWLVTSHITNGEEIIVKTPEFQLENSMTFSENGEFVLNVVSTDLTKSPPQTFHGFSTGTYSWNDGALTLIIKVGEKAYSVTGNADVSDAKLIFVATDMDKDYPLNISYIEAERL